MKNLVIGLLVAALGGAGGYFLGVIESQERESQFRDVITAARAVDLNQRLVMLRMLRQGQAKAEDLKPVEVTAINLLGTLSPGEIKATSRAHSMVKRVAQNLAAYMKDFPDSEFADKRHPEVAQLLAIGG